MNTLARFFNPFAHTKNQAAHHALYDVVENETIKGKDFGDLTLSGSLFSLTTFRDVTFESCVFFATRMENCTFINCRFENCSFQFSSIEHCQFCETEFQGSFWDVSPLKYNDFSSCLLDDRTTYFASKPDLKNKLKGSVRATGPIEIEDEVSQQAQTENFHIHPGKGHGLTEEAPYLPPLPTEDDGPTKTLKGEGPDPFGSWKNAA